MTSIVSRAVCPHPSGNSQLQGRQGPKDERLPTFPIPTPADIRVGLRYKHPRRSITSSPAWTGREGPNSSGRSVGRTALSAQGNPEPSMDATSIANGAITTINFEHTVAVLILHEDMPRRRRRACQPALEPQSRTQEMAQCRIQVQDRDPSSPVGVFYTEAWRRSAVRCRHLTSCAGRRRQRPN